MADQAAIEAAKERFGRVMEEQLDRVDRLKAGEETTDFSKISPIIAGIIGGDGIGPTISAESQRVLEHLLEDLVAEGKVQFKVIEGLTIENRAEKLMAIPDDVLEEIKSCHVTLKGPTHTPEQGDPWPNIESANVAMRKALDLFANVRPVRIPSQGIDWTFFRENTEDMYAVGSQGINVTPDLAVDFRIITTQGSQRLIEAAFAHARRTSKKRVTVVTKANVVKTTDGKFLNVAKDVASRYPELEWDAWYIDIMTAKLIDPKRRAEFPGARPAQPLRRYPDRRGRRDSGRRGHRRRLQHRRQVRYGSRQSTAALPAWSRRAGPSTPTPAPCSGPAPCCWSTSASRS